MTHSILTSIVVKLPAHFLVWTTSPEARFLRGRFVWANWDVEQLKARAKEIEESAQMLTSNILGWPYLPKDYTFDDGLYQLRSSPRISVTLLIKVR